MTDTTIHYLFVITIILSYIIPVLASNRPMKMGEFRIKFKRISVIILILISLFGILPNGEGLYFLEANFLFIIFNVSVIFYISARRYLAIGGSRWNTFVVFIHFPEFMRLWWEEPADTEVSSVQQLKKSKF